MFSEIILSAFTGDVAIVDGMNGTVMIAGEAAGAVAVAAPYGEFVGAEGDVACWTDFGAQTAVKADIGVNTERLIGNHEAVEEAADDVGESPRQRSLDNLSPALFPVF